MSRRMRSSLALLVVSVQPALAAGQPAAAAPDLAITASFAHGRWLQPEEPVELRIGTPPAADGDRLAILIGRTDWTDLFEADATALRYRPSAMPLPRGEHELTVFLVSPDGRWQRVAQFPLRVLHPGGFEQVTARPTLELASEGQAAMDRSPAMLATDRERYQDFRGTLGLAATVVRSGWTSRNQMNVVGVSNEPDALRYATEGAEAPAVDLADYLMEVGRGRALLSVGHVTWDDHRLLASQFATRGVAASVRLAPAIDLSVHAMNGTSVVGWSNFFGLNRSEHQVQGATLGVELVPGRPGALRIATTYLDGSLLPLGGYTRELVNDAETSQAGGLRVTASDRQGRLRFDAGYSRSRFSNPDDPLLAQGFDLVPVRTTSRDAHYLDADYTILQGRRIGRTQATLAAGIRHSRADPLYRSVAALVEADRLRNAVELNGSIGQFTSQAVWGDEHDNLDGLPSLMTTTTRTVSWRNALPLAAFRSGGSAWLPMLTYTFDRQHQAGDQLPPNSLFDSPSHVPDQANTNHVAGVQWSGPGFQAGYLWNRSVQDNRQPGRDRADFDTLVHTIAVTVSPATGLDLGLDASLESAENREAGVTDLIRRVGVTGMWRVASRTSVNGAITATFSENDPSTREGRTTDLRLQLTQGLALLERRPQWLQGQVFVRFARQTMRLDDIAFGLGTRQQYWSVNTGVTFRVF